MWGDSTASCCGIFDIAGTQDCDNTATWFRGLKLTLHDWRTKPSMILFTAVVKYGSEAKEDILQDFWASKKEAREEWIAFKQSEKIGPAVAKIIREEKLGKVRASHRTVNPNHGNTIQAWFWVPDYEALEKYVGTL